MEDEVRVPDIEIIVGCAGNDIAVFCFYLSPDIHQGYEVLSGVSNKASRSVVKQILQDALKALDAPNWHTVDELRQAVDEEENDPPF